MNETVLAELEQLRYLSPPLFLLYSVYVLFQVTVTQL